MAIRRRAREAQISRFKASFAYCASRRRVFGRPITVACHFPLGYFFSLFLCRSSEVRCPFPGFCVFLSFPRHTCTRSRACLQEDYFNDDFSEPLREQTGGPNDSRRVDRSSSITHVGSPLILASPQSPRAFPRSFTRFPFIRSSASESIASRHHASARTCSYRRPFAFNDEFAYNVRRLNRYEIGERCKRRDRRAWIFTPEVKKFFQTWNNSLHLLIYFEDFWISVRCLDCQNIEN